MIRVVKHIYKNKWQYIRFLISGSTAAITNILFLALFTEIFKIWYVISAGLSFIIAFFVSFTLQKFWTFKHKFFYKIRQEIFMYLGVALFGLAVNVKGIYLLVELIRKHYAIKYDYILVQIAISLVLSIINFIFYKFIIFKFEKSLINKDLNLKVLIATGIYPPEIGGPATYAKNLGEELKNLECKVKIITYGERGEDNNIIYVNKKNNIIIRYFIYFFKSLKLTKDNDIIYILDLISAGLPALIAAKLRGKKVIFRTGGDFLWEKAIQKGWSDLPLEKYYKAKKNFKEKIYFRLCVSILKKIDLILFSTEFQASIYKRYYKVADTKVVLMPNPVKNINIKNINYKYKDYFVFAGRFIKIKNLYRLIESISKLDKAKLLIIGSGPEYNNLKNKIIKLKIEDRITILNNLEHMKLMEIIAGCKFFVLPSISEISPNLALECLSINKPIIITKETGLKKELLDNLITVNPLSEEDIKEKIEYLLVSNNLNNYEKIINGMKIQDIRWNDIAYWHLNIFKKYLKDL